MNDNTLSPKIFEYEDGRLRVTAEAYMIPEIKDILDKHGNDADPYLAYVHLMTWLHSPYANYDRGEKSENVIYDVINSIGDFDIDEPLLVPALDKLEKMNTTPLTSFFLEVKEELNRMRVYLRDNEIKDGKDGNLSDRFRILKEAATIVASYNKSKTAAEEEIKVKGRGKSQVGEY